MTTSKKVCKNRRKQTKILELLKKMDRWFVDCLKVRVSTILQETFVTFFNYCGRNPEINYKVNPKRYFSRIS